MQINLQNKITHIVVLMLENRSFDHLLGGQRGVNGASPSNINYLNSQACPQNPCSVQNPPNTDPNFNPKHDLGDMLQQIFGPDAWGFQNDQTIPPDLPPTTPPKQSGYAQNYGQAEVMDFFPRGELPVFDALADNFCVCDNWFCDVPADTLPNRLFMHAATSEGQIAFSQAAPLSAKTIYAQIDRYLAGPDETKWRIYSFPSDNNDGTYFDSTRNDPRSFYFVRNPDSPSTVFKPDFFDQVAKNELPFYSFLCLYSILRHPGSATACIRLPMSGTARTMWPWCTTPWCKVHSGKIPCSL